MNIKNETLQIITSTLDVDKEDITEDEKLYDSIGVDSTEMVELTVALSRHFGIKIETNEITKFSTPQDIFNVIENKNTKK